MWLGTATDGLYRIRVQPVRVVGAEAGLTDGQVLTIREGVDGGVVTLDAERFVVHWSRSRVDTVFVPSREVRASAAMADALGTIWVSLYDNRRRWFVGHELDGSEVVVDNPTGYPSLVVADPETGGLRWVTDGAVWRLRPSGPRGPWVERIATVPATAVRDVLVARDGATWVAALEGVVRVSDGGVESFAHADGYPTYGARALHESPDGAIWIGRYFGGLVRLRDGVFGQVRAVDGLWDDVVSAILADTAGNLWMNSNRGIHRVSLVELDAFLDGRLPAVSGTGYGVGAGLRNAEGSGWPAHRSRDGRLWFPTFGGAAVVDPAEVAAYEGAAPRVRIRSVVADGRVLADREALTLELGSRRFDVAYGATLLSGQSGMGFQVRLDDVDADWSDVGGQRRVSYGNVPPGRHFFRVRAVSGAGVASVEEAVVALVVPPYFRETWGFFIVVGMLAGSALTGLYLLRTRQLRAREATLRRLVDERTFDLARAKARTEAALGVVESQAKELRSLDEAKSRFFANVSHELRTPLTLVQGPLQDVLDGRFGPTSAAVQDQVRTILASGRRLGDLVEQLLDVARIESGEFRIHPRRVDLQPLLQRLAASFGALGRRRGVELEVAFPEGPAYARVDADQIEKVLANLLSNAFKFTPGGGHVRFAAGIEGGPDGSELVIRVEDDGPGIAAGELGRIFERFHQVDTSPRRRHGGAGLGLALVKEIAERHGGSVEVRSEVGVGSRFTVRVPAAGSKGSASSTPTTLEEVVLERPEIPSDAADALPIGGSAPRGSAQAVPDEGPGTGEADADDPEGDAVRPTILVVEDHDELRAYLRRHLGDDYRVVEATDGAEGLEQARRVVPDVVICDIMMPRMDGEALCRAIRADPELDFLPVIMVTAKASRHSKLSAFGGGADDYIVKPFDPEELRLRVGNLLAARRRLEKRLREEGKTLPFVPLDLPEDPRDRSFTESLDAVLREHLGDEDFDVSAMARSLFMSRATLYRKTSDALGLSPMETLWRFRLRHAAHWLTETDGTVSEVAYACGFKTVPHFSRRFKDMFGRSPASYRDAAPG